MKKNIKQVKYSIKRVIKKNPKYDSILIIGTRISIKLYYSTIILFVNMISKFIRSNRSLFYRTNRYHDQNLKCTYHVPSCRTYLI